MKIINREKFIEITYEVLYSKYTKHVFGGLNIKCETIGNDFVTQQLADSVKCNNENEFSCILDVAESTGQSFSMDFDFAGRDGTFDKNQLFVVWEREDVLELISRLEKLVVEHPEIKAIDDRNKG